VVEKIKRDVGYHDTVIIGAGPAGMFAADELQKNGIKDILLIDMGKQMDDRKCNESPKCSCSTCDILEGEGGAGGFSDGKKTYSLSRGTQMEELFDEKHAPILREIDDTIVRFGGAGRDFDPLPGTPEEFKGSKFEFGSYPLRHIGSDGVRDLIRGHAEHLRANGVRTWYEAEATHLIVRDGVAIGILIHDRVRGDTYEVRANRILVATGLQGAPWLEDQLRRNGVNLGSGPAGIGVRIEAAHEVLAPLFDRFYDFKLVYEHGSLIYRSFCCNQRGYIVNENHRTLGIRNVNGHSYLDPDLGSRSSNFAIICKVGLGETHDPQSFVRAIAKSINDLAGGHPVVQTTKDFVHGNPQAEKEENIALREERLECAGIRTNHQARFGPDIAEAMPNKVRDGFRGFLKELDAVIPGIVSEESLVYAPEVKYYGRKVPVDFNTWECKEIADLYVLGNASGYLDSFVSAALTGVIAARKIIQSKGGNEYAKD